MKINSTILFFVIILLLISCKKGKETDNESNCIEINHGTISFTPQELLIQPYGVHDSLVFINETLNTLVSYKCTDQVTAYQIVSENEPDSFGKIKCLGNYYETEYSITKFYNSTKKFIYFSETVPYPFDTIYKENGIHIGLGLPGDTIYPFDGYFAFQKDTLYNYPYLPVANICEFYDTINIGNKLYHHVYLLEGSHLPVGFEKIIKIFYSISDGILRFSTNKDNVWSLKQKFILH